MAGQCYKIIKLLYPPLRHRERLHSLGPFASRWDHVTEFWRRYWPKVKYVTFSELAIKYPSQLPPYFFSISMSKKVAELCNVRSLDKWGFFFKEKHWGKPSDQEYINRARQELERKIFTGFSHCNLGICLLQQYTLAYFD